MPVVGFSTEQQSSGGQFRFAEGRGRIVSSRFVNHSIPGYGGVDCKWELGIQRLDGNGKPTSDDVVYELLGFGSVEHFHPGKVTSPAKGDDPELEFGQAKDAGYMEGADGLCLIGDKTPDRQCKASTFVRAAEAQGVKPSVFNGTWAPSIIGLEANFTQLMLTRAKNSTSQTDPTCLVIGRGGKEVPAEKLVFKYPDGTGVNPPGIMGRMAGDQAGGVTGGSGGIGAPMPPTPTPNLTPTPTPNPVPSPVASEPVSAPQTNGAGSGSGQTVEDIALTYLIAVQAELAGQEPITRKKLWMRMLTRMFKGGVPVTVHGAVQKLIKTDEIKDGMPSGWFKMMAENMDWVTTGNGETGTVQVPSVG